MRLVTTKTFDSEKPDGAVAVEVAKIGDYDGVVEREIMSAKFGGGREEEGG